MKKLYINSVLSLSCSFMISYAFANGIESEKDGVNGNNRNGDSVMTPGTMVKPALGTVSKKQGNSTNYIPNQSIEYSSAPCPAGYSSNGSSSFRTGQRLTTNFYTNGELMKTTRSDWLPINESCTGAEDQTVSCPSGYTGSVQQRRTATYNTSGYSYGGWSDISNSCVIIPPPPPPVVTPPVVVVPPVVTPPVVNTSRQWYQTANWSEFDAYAYSGSSRVYHDCATAYGRKTIRIYYGGGNGSVIQGMAELEKAMSPGGACDCDEKSPNGGYSIEGIGGDYAWREDYACWTSKEIEEFEAAKYSNP